MKLNKIAYPFFLVLSILLIHSCTLGPRYSPPFADVPYGWKTPQDDKEIELDLENWWEVFEDPILNCLEQFAVENNKDLEIAIDRIEQERARAAISKADLYPQINIDGRYNNVGALIKVFGIPSVGNKPSPNVLRVHELLYSLTFQMRYDLDIWGKFRNQYKAGLLNVESVVEAYLATMLAMTTDLAIQYFQLRSLDTEIDILERTIKTRQASLDINKTRYEKKIVNFTDVSRAEVLLYRAEADLFEVKRRRSLHENVIALLLGIPASEFNLDPNPLMTEPPLIPAGIPSDILLKRPDILEAERHAAAQHALINSSYGALFPSLSLTGEFGSSSPDFKDFLTWKSRFWQFGAQLTDPLFDGFKNLSNLDLAKANFCQASAEYQQIVLSAFKDVEDALTSIELQREQEEFLDKALESSIETTRLSGLRYLKGLDNYLEVVDSERSELELKKDKAELLGSRYTSTVLLIKALGGCW